MRRIVPLLVVVQCMAAIVPTPALAGENRKVERIEVPGGISAARLNTLWLAAKKKCYEMDYDEIVEERDLQTLVCKQDNLNLRMIFDKSGFTIKADAFFSKMPILGGLPSTPRKNRRAMIETLLAVR